MPEPASIVHSDEEAERPGEVQPRQGEKPAKTAPDETAAADSAPDDNAAEADSSSLELRVGASDPPSLARRVGVSDDGDSADSAAEASRWFRRGDQLFTGVLVIAALVLMGVHWVWLSGHGLAPVEIERLSERRFDFQLEINQATWVEWLQLEGIGDALAHRIVEDRKANGPFADIDDLARVKGIGPKTIERLRPWLRVEPVERISREEGESTQAAKQHQKAQKL